MARANTPSLPRPRRGRVRSRPRAHALAFDLGTTYLKGIAVDCSSGEVLGEEREPSPWSSALRPRSNTFEPNRWWIALERVGVRLQEVVGRNASAIGVTGVSPTLVAFDALHPEAARGLPYWWLPEVDGNAVGPRRTELRLRKMVEMGLSLADPVITDLIGYLVFRLTGNLTINTCTMSEMGITTTYGFQTSKGCSPVQCAPLDVIGYTRKEMRFGSGADVIAGCPDSLSAALAAGLSSPGEIMVYLGTFGSLMEVTGSIEKALSDKCYQLLPYKWSLSVPRFGPTVDKLVREWFPERRSDYELLERSAARSRPGAEGLYWRLPTWDPIGRVRGRFHFSRNSRNKGPSYSDHRSRAVLESLGLLINASRLAAASHPSRVVAIGGGTASSAWTQGLSDVLGWEIALPSRTGSAAGACALASRVSGILGQTEPKWIVPGPGAFDATEETRAAAAVWYQRQGATEGCDGTCR